MAGPDHVLVRVDSLMATFDHSSLPAEEQAWREAVAAGHQRHGGARLHGLFHQPDLLGSRPAPPPLD